MVGTPHSNYVADQHQPSQKSAHVGSGKKPPEMPPKSKEKQLSCQGACVLLGAILTVTDVQQPCSVISR